MKQLFNFKGVDFEVDLKQPFSGNTGGFAFYITPDISATLVDQYCKAKYPDLLVRIETKVSKSVSALHVWVCTNDANIVSNEVYEDIRDFAELFECDTTDWYHGADHNAITPYKTVLKLAPLVNDVYVYYLPKIGTPEWIEYQLKVLGRTFEQSTMKIKAGVINEWKQRYAS